MCECQRVDPRSLPDDYRYFLQRYGRHAGSLAVGVVLAFPKLCTFKTMADDHVYGDVAAEANFRSDAA